MEGFGLARSGVATAGPTETTLLLALLVVVVVLLGVARSGFFDLKGIVVDGGEPEDSIDQ